MADTKTAPKAEPKKAETKKVEKKADPVVEAAVAVVDSNGKPRTVVALAEALNKAKKPETAHNPYGVVVEAPAPDTKE